MERGTLFWEQSRWGICEIVAYISLIMLTCTGGHLCNTVDKLLVLGHSTVEPLPKDLAMGHTWIVHVQLNLSIRIWTWSMLKESMSPVSPCTPVCNKTLQKETGATDPFPHPSLMFNELFKVFVE